MGNEKFITDNQTLDDLNILGQFKSHSIFSLFNRTITFEGGRLLQQMFDHPLTDVDEINERKEVFLFFEKLNLQLPFEATEFELVESYLKTYSFSSRIGASAHFLLTKVKSLVINDSEYEALMEGLDKTIKLFPKLKAWISPIVEAAVNTPYQDRAQRLNDIVHHPLLDVVYENAGEDRLSFAVASKIDSILKSSLKDEVGELLKEIYSLDVFIAVSEVSRERSFCYPSMVSKSEKFIRLEGVYHPMIPHAVANDIYIGKEQHVFFLTGANMAGKSTFMKSFAIAVYLAHMGFPVAAKSMTLSLHDGIYTSINVPDNLDRGYSHFYAEVMRVKHIAQEVAKDHQLLIIFDELFKGTNVKDAYDGTVAIVDAFSKRNGTYIISTHIMEAGKELRKSNDRLFFKYLPTIVKGTKPIYTYILEDGITDDRQGMMIINNEGIIDMINGGTA